MQNFERGSSLGEAYTKKYIPPELAQAILSTSEKPEGVWISETNIKRREAVRNFHRETLNQQLSRLFGETQEEKKRGLKRMYRKIDSTPKILETLRKRGVKIGKKRFKRLRRELGIDSLKPPKGPKRGRVKQDRVDLVREAREKGFIDKLPAGMQKVLEQRYPQEGKPKTLSDIGAGMERTRGRVRDIEARALRRIRRLLEGKRQTDVGRPRDDIDANEVTRLYTVEKKIGKIIAKLMNCDKSTIYDRLREAGEPIRSGGRRMEIDINLLVWDYFVEGVSATKIAEPLGISKQTVLSRLREAGCPIRLGRPRKK